MREDSTYRFAHILHGAPSFSEMSRSILGLYETAEATVTLSQKVAERIINPKLSIRVTPNTKGEIFETVAGEDTGKRIKQSVEAINKLPPSAREATRQTPRGINPEIVVRSIDIISDRVVGEQVDFAQIQNFIAIANKAKDDLMKIVSPLHRVANRCYGKYRAFTQVKQNTIDEFKGVRGRSLAEWARKSALTGLFYKPAVFLFRDGPNVDLEAFLNRKSPVLTGITDLLVFVLCKEDESVADLQSLDRVFVVAKANADTGSFGGSSLMDLAILNQLLSVNVCL